MSPQTIVLYLAVLALSIKVTLGAVQSGTFNSLLAKFHLPPIPTAVFPWLGAGLGLAAGVVQGIQSGDTFADALAKALAAMLTGALATLHTEFISGRSPVIAGQDVNSKGGPAVPAAGGGMNDTLPPTPPNMRRSRLASLAFAGIVVIAVLFVTQPREQLAVDAQMADMADYSTPTPMISIEGCSWWAANSASVVTYTEADAVCVLGQLFTGGAVDPAAIALACAPVTIEQIAAILASIVDFYVVPSSADAGTDAASAGATQGQHCGNGPPPIKGLPPCVSHETLLRVMAIHVGLQRQIHAKASK